MMMHCANDRKKKNGCIGAKGCSTNIDLFMTRLIVWLHHLKHTIASKYSTLAFCQCTVIIIVHMERFLALDQAVRLQLTKRNPLPTSSTCSDVIRALRAFLDAKSAIERKPQMSVAIFSHHLRISPFLAH